jgi:hypothetical protein
VVRSSSATGRLAGHCRCLCNLFLHGDPADRVPDEATVGEAVLALAEVNETWDGCEAGWDDDYRRCRYGYWDADDEQDEEAEEGSGEGDYELNDLIDSSIRLTAWTDPDGTTALVHRPSTVSWSWPGPPSPH